MARYTHTDFKTKMSIHSLIGQQIKRRDDGLYEYRDGWSDAKIADTMQVKIGVVQRLRGAEFGSLHQTAQNVAPINSNHFNALRRRIERIEQALGLDAIEASINGAAGEVVK